MRQIVKVDRVYGFVMLDSSMGIERWRSSNHRHLNTFLFTPNVAKTGFLCNVGVAFVNAVPSGCPIFRHGSHRFNQFGFDDLFDNKRIAGGQSFGRFQILGFEEDQTAASILKRSAGVMSRLVVLPILDMTRDNIPEIWCILGPKIEMGELIQWSFLPAGMMVFFNEVLFQLVQGKKRLVDFIWPMPPSFARLQWFRRCSLLSYLSSFGRNAKGHFKRNLA